MHSTTTHIKLCLGIQYTVTNFIVKGIQSCTVENEFREANEVFHGVDLKI